jgi:2-oxoglutarate ferredoxin oxidoreductase subunit beta
MNTNALQTTHGGVLAFAAGLKMTRPSPTVVVTMGDGDALAIGGNHFLHAARRNLDVTVLLYNNAIYGMTGGQLAPTTPEGSPTTTSLQGSMENAFDAVALALAAGATYVARTTTFDMQEMPLYIQQALAHPGFALVDILTQCPTYYGRLNRIGDASDMLLWERDLTEPGSARLNRQELIGSLSTGLFRRETRPEYTQQYAALCNQTREGADV